MEKSKKDILAIGVISPSSLVGISPGGSSVKTDWYCLFSAAAFCLGVDSRLSFSFSVGILLVLLLLLLIADLKNENGKKQKRLRKQKIGRITKPPKRM
jgi:hypothetical protein